MYERKAIQQFGQWLSTCRQKMHMTHADLATAMGCQNRGQGSRLVDGWERGNELPEEQDIPKLKKALEISDVAWTSQMQNLEQSRKKEAIYNQMNDKIKRQTQAYVAQYADILMANTDEIVNTSNWRHIQMHGLKVGMMYVAGVYNVQLGSMLFAWQQGLMIKETDEGTFYAMDGGGSPLSSLQTFNGFYKGTTTPVNHRRLTYPLASFIVPAINLHRERNNGGSSWSLPQLLCQIGVTLPAATIWHKEKEIGSYNFKSCVLTWRGKQIPFPLTVEDAHRITPIQRCISEEWGPKYRRGVPVIGNVSTAQMGGWQGERWEVNLQGNKWLIRPGSLYNPHGYPTMHWDMDLPPMVQEWIAMKCNENFTDSQ